MEAAGHQKEPSEEFRAKAHEALDAWLNELEPMVESAHSPEPPRLFDLSLRMMETRSELLGALLTALLQRLVRCFGDIGQTPCPDCEKTLYRKRMARRTIQTIHGPASFQRPYFYCADCQEGVVPFDDALEMAREVHQYDVQSRISQLAAKMPYEEAVKTYELLTGRKVGTHLAHETVQRIEQALAVDHVLPAPEAIYEQITAAKEAAEEKPPVLVVAVDGAFAPIRPRGGRRERRGPGSWREVKGFRIYLSDPAGRITSLMSWHQIETAEELTEHLQLAAARLGPDHGLEVALVADGAAWIWSALEAAFPSGRQVLDYYHCAEHVWEAAHARYAESDQAQDWAEATLVRLGQGWISHVLGGLARMKPETEASSRTIEKLRGYLHTHRDRLDYKRLKQEGLPRGSGAIESFNKYIIHTRLKRPGAWWLEANGNGMLRLRCAFQNGTFMNIFRAYMARNDH